MTTTVTDATRKRYESIAAEGNLAERIGATGMPTVVISGIRYPEPPDAAALRRIIEAAGGR